MLCCRDHYERVVASFAQKLKPEYYGGNIYVSIEGIAPEHFSALTETEINSSTKPCPRHAVFNYFSDDSKQDDDTTTSHSKRLIEI